MRLWAISPAHGIEPERVRAIVRTWRGFDGICLVLGMDDPEPADDLPKPLRIVRSAQPFARSTWRNLGTRFAPTDAIVAIDIDCALLDPRGDFIERTKEALGPEGSRRLVAYRWTTDDEENTARVLAGDLSQLGTGVPSYPVTGATGLIAMYRRDAIEVSWDDTMTGWGGEDQDFHSRAERHGFASVWLEGYFGHVWHGDRGRSRAIKRANIRRSMGRDEQSAADLGYRAEREICMDTFIGVSVEGRTDVEIRRAVREEMERRGWPALVALDRGEVPGAPGAFGPIYDPLLGVRVTDRT